jgi:hypothetical protein
MFAWIFDSLSRRADQWVHEWGSTSGELSRRKYPFTHKLVRQFAEHPALHILGVLFLTVSISLLCWVAPRFWGFQIAATEYTQSDLLTYFCTLWALQATLAALVYPLVIAFVAVMLQRRAAAKLSLRLYAIDAAVAPSGASALALVAWMTVLYLALPYVPLGYISTAMVGCILWFLHNLLLTGWFLYRTVKFLDDSLRYEVFTRFAVRVAFPREVHGNLLGLIFSHAQEEQILPGKSYGSDEAGPVVALYPLDDGEPFITIDNPEAKAVVDVRLRLLRWGVRLWLRKVRHEARRDMSVEPASQGAMLVLPFVLGRKGPDIVTVCRVKDAPLPGFFSKFLIRHSIVLGPVTKRQFDFSCADVLEELVIETLTLAEQKRFEAAKEAVAALIDVHAALIKAGAFQNSAGQPDNAVLLPNPYAFGEQRFHEDWLSAYRPLSELAVQSLSTNTVFYERICYFVYGVVNRLKSEHIDVLIKLLQLSGYLMYRLGLWWTGQIEERGILTHNANNAAVLALPQGALYDRAMQNFVEGWEAIRIRDREQRFSVVDDAWASNCRYARFAGAQLSQLCRMILGAVGRGDRAAATWLLESFTKWFGSQYFLDRHMVNDNGHHKFMTFADFQRPWSAIRSEIGVADGANEFSVADVMLTKLLHRYWTDLRLVMALILLDWVAPEQANDSFALELAAALIAGRNPKTGHGEIDGFTNPELILMRLQRIEGTREYSAILDSLISEGSDLRRPAMMSGRIYSRWGADDLESLCRAQGHLLVALTTGQVARTPQLTGLIGHLRTDLQGLAHAARTANEIAESIDVSERDATDSVSAALRQALGHGNDLLDSRVWTKELLKQFADAANMAEQSAIESAPLSGTALKTIAHNVSAFVLSAANQEFPFTISESCEPVGTDFSVGRLNFNGVRKAPLTEPPLEHFSEHDHEHYGSYLTTAIGAQLVWAYINRNGCTPLPASSGDAFVEGLSTAAQSIRSAGKTPLIILSSQAPPWAATHYGPSDSETWPSSLENRHSNAGDVASLLCYWNGIEAHRVSLTGDGCYVVPKEDFHRLSYTASASGDCVSLGTSTDTAITVKLEFTWSFGIVS